MKTLILCLLGLLSFAAQAQTGFPTINRNRNGEFRARLERESMPLNAAYTTRTGSYNNSNLLGNSPGATAAWWVDNVSVTATESCTIAVQIGGSYNPAIGWYMPYIVTPGRDLNVPINSFISENTSITVTILGSGGTANFFITACIQGRIVSADFMREEADRVVLEIGDSIGSGSGITATEQNYNYKLRDSLEAATGRTWRVIRKSMGTMTAVQMETFRLGGKLDVIQPDVIVYNMGMNDPNPTTYTTAANNTIAWLRKKYPSAYFIVCGPTRRTDAQETNLVTIRANAAAAVTAANNSKMVYVNLGDLAPWTSANHTSTYAPDGTHPNAAGHALMYNALWSVFTANSNAWINTLK